MTSYDAKTPAKVLVQDYVDIIREKVVLITGTSLGGLGAFFVQQIAVAKPKQIIITGRNKSKAQAVADSVASGGVAIKILEVDFASLDSVRRAAAEVNSWDETPNIDVLVNNAGILAVEYNKSVDGFELNLATNHLGPWLFTNLILDKIMYSAEPRIVFVSSDGHRLSPMRWGDYDFHDGTNYNCWAAYGQTKTANMLSAVYLAEKGPKGLTTNSVDPGNINTHIQDHIDWNVQSGELEKVDKFFGHYTGWATTFEVKEPTHGVSTHIYAAFEPELRKLKAPYLLDNRRADPRIDNVKPWATSLVEAEMMWELSERLTESKFSFEKPRT